MKKMRKLLAICCLVCLLLPLLCGCRALDEMRASQAFYDQEGNVLWNGAVYKKLPQGEYFSPEIDYNTSVCVTEQDVPVLVQEMFCKDSLYVSEDGTILESYAAGEAQYYCREDRHEELSQRLKEPFRSDMVCYFYYTYDEETDEYAEKIYRLSDDEWGVLRKILETAEPMQISEGWNLSYDRIVSLEECSEDRLFCRQFLDLILSGETYYLRFTQGLEVVVYEVPEEAVPHVAKIMDAEWEEELLEPEIWIA